MYVHYAAESVHWNTGKHALDDRAVCTNSSVFTPPVGYLKNETVYDIDADGKEFKAEYNEIKKSLPETPIKGDVSIIKGMGNGEAGIVPFEKNAQCCGQAFL